MTQQEAPFVRVYDLGDLGRAGDRIVIALKDPERSRLAKWADVIAVDMFEAVVSLEKLSASRFTYKAKLDADIVQSCVVTLEPVRSHVASEFVRELQLAGKPRRHEDRTLEPEPAEAESPEAIESLDFDLASPLLEEFSLAIDPYPRAPGVEFEAPGSGETPQKSPFAALKALTGRR